METEQEAGQMEVYTEFARVYDTFMDNIDYDAWAQYLIGKLKRYHIEEGLICELGCGTGSMTERLSTAGYDMIGIDASAEMLESAMKKQYEKDAADKDILYLNQDMREFELYGTVRAIVSVCDCLNYLLEEEDLLQVFSLVNNYLDPDGIFLFDMNTAFKYETIGNDTIAENRDEGSFIWENDYDAASGINQYLLTLFLPEGSLYRKYEELHRQRAYTPETIKRLLEEAGMEFLGCWEAFTDQEISETTERMYFAAREKGKKERIARHEL
jgi:SAM-dependent methyltransferase